MNKLIIMSLHQTGTFLKAAVLAAAASLALCAASPAQVFQSQAPQAILFDVETGSILYQKGADEPFQPGSLTKLMTLEVVFRELK